MIGASAPFLFEVIMKRITVFHGNKTKFVQAVISDDQLEYFKKIGFVESVDKLKATRNGNNKK